MRNWIQAQQARIDRDHALCVAQHGRPWADFAVDNKTARGDLSGPDLLLDNSTDESAEDRQVAAVEMLRLDRRDNAAKDLFLGLRRPNWKPVIVPSGHRAENGNIGKGETISHAAEVFTWVNSPTGDGLGDLRFTIGAALVLGLPVLIGAGLYLAAIVVLS